MVRLHNAAAASNIALYGVAWGHPLCCAALCLTHMTPLNTLYAFNETTGLWEDLPPMLHASSMAASGVIGNELFIAGGYYGVDKLPSTLQIYDFTTRTWRLGGAPAHSVDHAALLLTGSYILSLRDVDLVGEGMLVYDVQSNTWDQQIPPHRR